jgi:hypothetical protein
LGEPLAGERTELLDVVSDHGALFAAGDFEDDVVGAPRKVVAFGYGCYVIARLAQQERDLR